MNRAVQPFEPHSLPLNELDWRQLLPLVGQANAALARCENLPGDVVISDVRFPNEAEAIRAEGAANTKLARLKAAYRLAERRDDVANMDAILKQIEALTGGEE